MNICSPMYHVPMPPEEFQQCQQAQMQNFALSDPQEMAEIARHQRAMERDVHKARLKDQSYALRQQIREKRASIVQEDGQIVLIVVNGKNQILRKVVLFCCHILDVKSFRYEGTEQQYWQLILREGRQELCSELYPEKYLRSISKLQQTVLINYDCTVSEGERTIAWKWLRGTLCELYNAAKQVQIPMFPGWYCTNGRWHFWSGSDENLLLHSPYCRQFYLRKFAELETAEIVDEIIIIGRKFASVEDLGILLIFQLVALMGRFLTDALLDMGLTLIGSNAVCVAEKCLRIMENEDNIDIVNMDSDRISRVRECVQKLQDTPTIFVSTNPDRRTVQNHLMEIISWLKNGIAEGKKVKTPFVFCLQTLSPVYPLDNTVIVATDDFAVPQNFDGFGKFRSLLVDKIEKSGVYWPEKFEMCYRRLQKAQSSVTEKDFPVLCQAIGMTVMEMLEIEERPYAMLQNILSRGVSAIKKQLSLRCGILTEIFKERVIELVDAEDIFVNNVSENKDKLRGNIVYYDEIYYYFTKEALQIISTKSKLNRKAILYIKQVLATEGLLKQYRTIGSHPSELEVDIFLLCAGEKRRVSVIAIKRNFWDEVGGIALYERGGETDADIV